MGTEADDKSTDIECLDRIAGGDQHSLERLYDRYSKLLLKWTESGCLLFVISSTVDQLLE